MKVTRILKPPESPGFYVYDSPRGTISNTGPLAAVFRSCDGFREVSAHELFGSFVFFVHFDTTAQAEQAMADIPPGRRSVPDIGDVFLVYQLRDAVAVPDSSPVA